MAWILADSFDFYNASIDMTVGPWDAYTGSLSTTSRFGGGRTAQINNANYLTKTNWGSNENEVILSIAIVTNAVFTGAQASGLYFQFRDASVAQVTVQVSQDGNLYVRTGSTTIVGTFPLGSAANVWMHLQIRVVIHPTAGSVRIRKNGNPADDYVVTNINTRGGTANNYVNGIHINGSITIWFLEDLLLFSTAGAAPNTWVGDVRSTQLMPTANTAQKNFSAISQSVTIGSNTVTKTIAANNCFLSPFTPAYSGKITNMQVNYNALVTGHGKVGIFAADNTITAGGPGTFLGASNEITNPAAGANNYTFSTPVNIVGGTTYWLGLLVDASSVMRSAGSAQTYMQPFTYPNFANITAAPAGAVAGTSWYAIYTYERDNFNLVQEGQQDGDTTYVFSDVVGAIDLYDLADFGVTPNAIIGVVAKQFVKKSDAAARTSALLVRSGSSTLETPGGALATSYTWQQMNLPTDPNTGVAWVTAGVNALLIGPKVVA